MNKQDIEKNLNSEALTFYKITCFEEVTSTNDLLKEEALCGKEEGLTFIAMKQTKGRGRRGRSFYSPDSTGLYMSILLRPDLPFEDAVKITTVAAVAGVKACKKVKLDAKDSEIGIKWVNDIYSNKKKIAGILTEAGLGEEINKLDYAVLGIGINITEPKGGFPEDICGVAGSLFGETAPLGIRSLLSAEFLNEFLPIYKTLPKATYLKDYRENLLGIGSEITVISGNEERQALMLGVNDDCELRVRFQGDDKETILNSGEISTRL